jgi:UTP--glucose-1-phosphate uridylyltransferase
MDHPFAPFAAKMQVEGIPAIEIEVFRRAYAHLIAGETGLIPGSVAQPVADVHAYDGLGPDALEAGREALGRAVTLKLNGGLGTSMGISGPKSLLPVKDGLTFLDITVRQVLHLRRESGARLPLILMNSFSTHEDSVAALARYPELAQDVPFDFLQNKVPKVWADTLTPAQWPDDPEKEWCPPGHGDIYPALVISGLLDRLLDAGYEYAFVSNVDNLGAVLDLRILGHVAANGGVPFLMEVAGRTAADSKGGHLAQAPDGRLLLRESAQCPPDEMAQFQDIRLYRYFNTNNLWLHLPALHAALDRTHGVLDLPLIRNEKPVDPTRPDSPRVYQLETAMGAAIGVMDGAQALCVPRTRFAPVKKNSDLLALWSDAYALTPDYHVELVAERRGAPPVLRLDDRYYGLIDDMRERFPAGAPSLVRCDSLTVTGDVRFGAGVVVAGTVTVENPNDAQMVIPDGALLT